MACSGAIGGTATGGEARSPSARRLLCLVIASAAFASGLATHGAVPADPTPSDKCRLSGCRTTRPGVGGIATGEAREPARCLQVFCSMVPMAPPAGLGARAASA